MLEGKKYFLDSIYKFLDSVVKKKLNLIFLKSIIKNLFTKYIYILNTVKLRGGVCPQGKKQ